MTEEFVKVEVNGTQVDARKGAMIIEVTDAMGIVIPRFCYHKKLSIAANCRMCLVEVERAPKPLPACATPVMEGMKVYTDSARALAAQKGTMEFLLINHPLDCPICDQGGECELQDISMGYGHDVSRFVEGKRVVKDKDIGPLIATEMTRCIHCTRCVRFGEEVAGLRELGATGRGEHMEIGTYIARSIESELSGNVIDLCPVGALTAKPSRFTGRSWEYVQRPSIAPHDSVGSNIFVHTIRNKVMRVVPRDNEAVNETWIADRDRFSYQGIFSLDRAIRPLGRGPTGAGEIEWPMALERASQGLRSVIDRWGTDAVGFLISPTATLEELYLAQKLARGLGVANIDHRLRQGDFSHQDEDPVYPWCGRPLEELEGLGAALLIGSNIRMEQPLAGHRIRKAAMAGAKIMVINPRDFDFRFPVAAKTIADPAGMISALAGVAKVVAGLKGMECPENLWDIVAAAEPTRTDEKMAEHLIENGLASVFLGNSAVAHPAFAQLRALAIFIAQGSDSGLGYLPEAANSAGGYLAGALPHRQAGGEASPAQGLDAKEMIETPRKAYVLLGVEPEFDCWNPGAALAAVKSAEFVVVMSPYASERVREYAHLVLPTTTFAETSGTFVNAEGRWQSFQGAIKPLGQARPAWKVLRVLGNAFDLSGFDYLDSGQVLEEVRGQCAGVEPFNLKAITGNLEPFEPKFPVRAGEIPIYRVDGLVRRASALQKTPLARPAEIRLSPVLAQSLNLEGCEYARIQQGEGAAVLPLVVDAGVPNDCIWLASGLAETAQLGPMMGEVQISVVSDEMRLSSAAP